jgi:23S rRNA (cytidine1920-2'-O)/16S rRNA (cytidine1409-2'-O)-methyltransferase
MRLDNLLFHNHLTSSRHKAKTLILEGKVLVNGEVVTKPSKDVSKEVTVTLSLGEEWQRVSRGGLKLEKALQVWNIRPAQWICLDVGASTGGFTEVLLHHGANKVYAIDVGHGQLADILRKDSRVVSLEGINARQMTPDLISEEIDFACIDVSFISLTLVLPEVLKFLKPHSDIVVLIKPQFEVGREGIGKKGVVKDPKQHELAIQKIHELAKQLALEVVGVEESPIRGGEGNREFLMYLHRRSQ